MTPAATAAPLITRPRAQPSRELDQPSEFALGAPAVEPTAAGAQAASVALEATLVAVDEEGRRINALPVVFRRRVTVGETATLLGTDPSQALRIVATVGTKPPSLKLNLRYSAGGPALPRELLASFRFLHALHRPNRLGLWIGDRAVGEPDELPADAGFPQAFVELVRSLAFVQTMSGTEFPLPSDLDDDDRRALREAEALLRGETVTSEWADATLGLSAIDTDLLQVVDGGSPFRLEFIAPAVVRVAGNDLALGEAQYVFRMARLENYDELRQLADAGDVSAAEAKLHPGTDDTYEVRLLTPPAIGFDEQDVRPAVAVAAADLAAARRNQVRRDAFKSAAS